MSYDGEVVSGWGVMARSSEEAHEVTQHLIDSGKPYPVHRSRVCHFVIDVGDLDQAAAFWAAALEATEDRVSPNSNGVYRKLRLPDADIRILLQKTNDKKASSGDA